MNPTDAKTQIQTRSQQALTNTAPKTIFDLVEAQKPAIQAAFGSTDEKYAMMFIRQARTQLQLNPMLQKCTPESFLGAMMLAAQLRLQLNPGMRTAYLVPYAKYKKGNSGYELDHYEAQFQIGVGGYQELFYRHEKSVSLDVFTVYDGDEFDYSLGTEPFIKHKPTLQNQGEPYAWYAVATLAGGHKKFLVMSRGQVMHNAMKSQSWDASRQDFKKKSAWADDFDGMAQKTVIKMLAKTLPMSTEITEAIAQDEAVKTLRPGVSIMDAPDEAYDDAPVVVQAPVEIVEKPAPVKAEPPKRTEIPADDEVPLPEEASSAPARTQEQPEQSSAPLGLTPTGDEANFADVLCVIYNAVGDDQRNDPLFERIAACIESGDDHMAKQGISELRAKYMASEKQVKAIHAMLKAQGKVLRDVCDHDSMLCVTKKEASAIFGKLKEGE
ncbi:MAG TPA: recombinase RecT [Candidatus Cloacimonadota bacterium]|nr:recombinase RecT [Candidatus Cloacimonadota bacterium]HPS38366.1 recombinase RecT [Candidatus Cloacimonadota bacterium]